jgi:hypothetical protein
MPLIRVIVTGPLDKDKVTSCTLFPPALSAAVGLAGFCRQSWQLAEQEFPESTMTHAAFVCPDRVEAHDELGMIVVYPVEITELAKAGLLGGDAHRYLHIDHLVCPSAHEVNLPVAQHADTDSPAILNKLEIDSILNDFPEVCLLESTEGATQAEILEVELLADLEEPPALDVVSRATMHEECGFEVGKVINDNLRRYRQVLGLEVFRNPLRGKQGPHGISAIPDEVAQKDSIAHSEALYDIAQHDGIDDGIEVFD